MKISTLFFVFFFCLFSLNLYAKIFYIEMDKIINQTNVGKYIKKELEKEKKKNNIKHMENKNLLKKREEL